MCCMWKYLRVNRRLSFCGCGKITHREWSGPSFLQIRDEPRLQERVTNHSCTNHVHLSFKVVWEPIGGQRD